MLFQNLFFSFYKKLRGKYNFNKEWGEMVDTGENEMKKDINIFPGWTGYTPNHGGAPFVRWLE